MYAGAAVGLSDVGAAMFARALAALGDPPWRRGMDAEAIALLLQTHACGVVVRELRAGEWARATRAPYRACAPADAAPRGLRWQRSARRPLGIPLGKPEAEWVAYEVCWVPPVEEPARVVGQLKFSARVSTWPELSEQVEGPDRSYLEHVAQLAGAELQLSGGSGQPVVVRVEATDPARLASARKSLMDLVDAVLDGAPTRFLAGKNPSHHVEWTEVRATKLEELGRVFAKAIDAEVVARMKRHAFEECA